MGTGRYVEMKLASTSVPESIPPHRIIEPSHYKELGNAATNAMVALAVDGAGLTQALTSKPISWLSETIAWMLQLDK
jgi:hypothetical protein